MPRVNPIERRLNRFLRNPASVRGAMGVIVVATGTVVVVAGVVMRLIDHEEYRSIWVGIWWALQTVTTVGYGDVTPHEPNGRIVAAFVMFEGIAFLAIVTAVITSTFVERAGRERERRDQTEQEKLETRFDELEQRLDRIERALLRLTPQ